MRGDAITTPYGLIYPQTNLDSIDGEESELRIAFYHQKNMRKSRDIECRKQLEL
jgi:hypothetical protein